MIRPVVPESWHHGYLGLWRLAATFAAATLIVGVLFQFDGRGTTSSPAYDPIKAIARVFGAGAGDEMTVWAAVLIALGAAGLVALTRSMRTWVYVFLASAIVWVLFAATFVAFAVQHDGLGAVGAVLWVAGALAQLTVVGAANDYFWHPRPR